MTADKNTIGLTTEGKRIVAEILEKGWFIDNMTVAKFAFSHAIKAGLEPGQVNGASTIWNKGSIDEDGGLKLAIQELYDETDTPYRLIEYFIDEGLKLIDEKIKGNPGISLSDLLGI